MFSKFQITVLVFLAAALGLTAGCSPRRTGLSAADNGKQVAVNAGEQLVVTLPGNPSTGYSWEAKSLDAGLLQQVGEAKFKSDSTNLVGSGGNLTLTFRALKPGTTVLTLVYHRPWETDVEPVDIFSVTVTIK